RGAWGNLVAGNGYLVVAGTEELFVYGPDPQALPRRRAEAARPGAPAAARYRLALAEAEAGQPESALETLARAERQARVGERYQGVLLRDLARARRQELVLDLGRRARAEKHWGEAAAWPAR